MTDPIVTPLQLNTAFSTEMPNLQIAWDSTSLGLLKECPRKYQLSIIEQWTAKQPSPNLLFGAEYHKAIEIYDHEKVKGRSHDEACREALRHCLVSTWDPELNRPWSSDHPTKNRFTLARSVIWYLEQFRDDPIETIVLANGKPAVELSFRFETQYKAPDGQPYLLAGHLDRLGRFQNQTWIVDRKTTNSTISPDYFARYSPDNQVSLYALSSKIVYNQPVAGLILDAAQIAVSFSRFQRGFVFRTNDQLEEWYHDLFYWFSQAAWYAHSNHWPMNEKSCSNFGGCVFREICAKSPSTRDKWLQASFARQMWDPLKVRGGE